MASALFGGHVTSPCCDALDRAILSGMAYTRDSPEPLGPLWDLVLPLVYGRRQQQGFDIAGVAGTCFIPYPGVVVSCAHCFGGMNEWEYALTRVPVDGAPAAVAMIRDVTSHDKGFDLAVGAFEDARFRPLPPFTIEEARIGMAVLAPGYPLPRRSRRSSADPVVLEATVRGMRGHVTSDGIVTGLGKYGALPSIELDLRPPGGLSGAPLFDWGLVQNPLKLVGVVRGSSTVSAMHNEPFPSEDAPTDVEQFTFGLASPSFAFRTLQGPPTGGVPLGELVAARWPY